MNFEPKCKLLYSEISATLTRLYENVTLLKN